MKEFASIRPREAFSLIEVLVTIAVFSIVGLAITRSNVISMKSIQSSKIRQELLDIKQTISGRLNCPKTLGTSIPSSCSTTVALLDKNGANIVPSNGKLGSWTITSRCEVLDGKNGLSIYATKPKASGGYATDPLNANTVLDESSPLSLLYKANIRPCAGYFQPDAASTCPQGTGMTGLDSSGNAICQQTSVAYSLNESQINNVIDMTTPGSAHCSTQSSLTYIYCMSGCSRYCRGEAGSGKTFKGGIVDEMDGSSQKVRCVCY